MPQTPNAPLARAYTPTALPSVTARILAFVAILLGGLCGGLIGYSVTDLQCGATGTIVVPRADAPGDAPPTTIARDTAPASTAERGCTTIVGVGAVVGAVVGAGGVAVIAVLVLRAMAEWRKELEVDDPPDDPGPAGAA